MPDADQPDCAAEPSLYGAAYSVYTRIARLALAEKQVAYRLVETDIFAAPGPSAEYLERQPFGRIPAFEHQGFRLYETAAICRYVDEAFPGPLLQPDTPRGRARLTQIVGMLDSYAYRPMIWDIFVERIRAPAQGRIADEARITAAMPRAATCLDALERLIDGQTWFAGETLSLADIHAAPIFAYFVLTPEGSSLMSGRPNVAQWWQLMSQRPSMAATRSPME
ncbi:glutathione S-transferase [Rhizobiales bacterium GAS191]|jgi:glutathione S-transferase|nr:glutathione S-transferase [Rhizobiales bacterium GAS113]SED62516.1 glutathione S-transferase [Rhizobiales bacterium GAS188]SEE86993.1 glutathione S-transferase [Rhizobiales bacterium GAS191]